ncbi:MAG: hypothetical protein WC583_02780 [Candidatus Omnitrophota bacterium]|jgi:hypothetical protein|nr:glycosyltransferase [Sphaerochaeta sp.]
MNVSVVVVTYRRLLRLPEILAAWLKETPDVWLCDCSRAGARGIPTGVKVVRFSPDPGNKVRHAVAMLTEGELVIKADDDIIPRPGLVADFIAAYRKTGPAILGIHGRTFHGRDYYRDTKLYGAKEQKAPLKVDFVGVITCTPRAFLGMDLRGCETEIEDLFWQMEKYPTTSKYVIPTDKFMHLPESRDAERLCAPGPARAIRRKYYERWYVRNYRPADRITG